MLQKIVKDVEALILEYVAELEKDIAVETVVLFGSYARGAPRDYSDIDLLVVSPDFHGGTEEDAALLDRAARKVNPLIEAIPYRPEDFEHFEKGDFVHAVRKGGKVVYTRAA